MLIELLSTSNYVSYNIKLAEILGLHAAIYLSELMNINDKAIRKDKLSENMFTLKREYIKKRTTLDETEQIAIEDNLLKLGILKKEDDPNAMSINISVLTTLMMTSDESLLNDCKQISSTKAKRQSKEDVVINNVKLCVNTKNRELREAYYAWIESVVARQGWIAKTTVIEAQAAIDKYSNRNLDVALEILKIAAINGYRDMQWAITKYAQNVSTNRINNPNINTNSSYTKVEKQLSSEVF